MTEGELDRIRRTYGARDAGGGRPYRWDNSGYVIFMHAVERAVLRALADGDVQLAGARVLDVGCGSGYFLHRFREYGARDCHGIDLMERRIAAGRERYPTLELRAGSATDLPYDDGAFDLVTQFTCLSAIRDEDMRHVVAAEMRRVSRGGQILSFDMRRDRALRRRAADGTATWPLDGRALTELFGAPTVLRSCALPFELAERFGSHPVVAQAVAAVPFLRDHLVGVWRSDQ